MLWQIATIIRYRNGTVNVDIGALREAVPEQVKTVRLIVTVGSNMNSESGVACKAHVVGDKNPEQVATWKLVNGEWISEKEPKLLQESDDGEAAAYMDRALLRKDDNPKGGGVLRAAPDLAVKAKLLASPEENNNRQRGELEQSDGAELNDKPSNDGDALEPESCRNIMRNKF